MSPSVSLLALVSAVLTGCGGGVDAPSAPTTAGPAATPAPAPPHAPAPEPAPAGTPARGTASVVPAALQHQPQPPLTDPPPGGWPEEPPAAGCPPDMGRVAGRDGDFCMHRFEVRLEGSAGPRNQAGTWPAPAPGAAPRLISRGGAVPSKGLTWFQAWSACAAEGLHLCSSAEWEDACDGQGGPGGRTWMVGDAPADTCNTTGAAGRLEASGRRPACRTDDGIYDLEGNLWEWVDGAVAGARDAPVVDKRGGAFYAVDRASCAQAAPGSHPPDFDGTIGFRCCRAVSDGPATPPPEATASP